MRTCKLCGYNEHEHGTTEWFPALDRVCARCFTWYLDVLHAIGRGVKSLRDEPEAMIDE